MKSIFGNSLLVSLFGESHSDVMGITIHGIKAGIKLDRNFISSELNRRKPIHASSTLRREDDEFKIVSGYFQDHTTGAPLTVMIANKHYDSLEYTEGLIRASHADYPVYIRSQGYNDYRGGGHFSGRITVLLVIAGAICKQILFAHEISITSKIASIGSLVNNDENMGEKITAQMSEKLNEIKGARDSIGGTIKVIASGIPIGVGEPFFDSVESILGHLFFSIPAVKGVEFGLGRSFSHKQGSEVADELQYVNGKVQFLANNNGGINGGLTNGEQIEALVTLKPTPTIGKSLKMVNLKTSENIEKKLEGRHDSAIVTRCPVICESCMAIGLLDLLCSFYKSEWM